MGLSARTAAGEKNTPEATNAAIIRHRLAAGSCPGRTNLSVEEDILVIVVTWMVLSGRFRGARRDCLLTSARASRRTRVLDDVGGRLAISRPSWGERLGV